MDLRIGFHKVVVASREALDFEEVLETARSLPDDESRTIDRPDGSVRMQFVRRSANVWQGELIRIRLGEEPKKANKKGRVQPIAFDEDEGLGEETAFLFDPELQMIAYHEHRGGVTLSNAARYFKAVGKARSVSFEPVLRPEAINRVARMGCIKQFIVHLAGVNTGRPLRNVGRSALSLFGAADEYLAPKAKFHFTIGPQGAAQRVKETIAELSHIGGDDGRKVTKLVVIGSDADNDDHAETVNLLEDRLVVTISVDLRNGRLSDARRRAAVYDAWLAQRDGLRAAYGARA